MMAIAALLVGVAGVAALFMLVSQNREARAHEKDCVRYRVALASAVRDPLSSTPAHGLSPKDAKTLDGNRTDFRETYSKSPRSRRSALRDRWAAWASEDFIPQALAERGCA